MMITLALAVAIIAGLVVWLIMKVDICLRQDVSTHHELKHMLDRIDAHYEIVMHHVVRVDELETKSIDTHLNIAGLREFVTQNIKIKREIQSSPKKGKIPIEAIDIAVKKVKANDKPNP